MQRDCTGYPRPRHPLFGKGMYTWGPASQSLRCRRDSCTESLRPPLLPFRTDALPLSCPGLSAGGCGRSSHPRTEIELTRLVGFVLLNCGHLAVSWVRNCSVPPMRIAEFSVVIHSGARVRTASRVCFFQMRVAGCREMWRCFPHRQESGRWRKLHAGIQRSGSVRCG